MPQHEDERGPTTDDSTVSDDSSPRAATESIGRRDLAAWPTRTGRLLARSVLSAVDTPRRWLDDRVAPYAVLIVTALIGVVVAGVFTAVSAEIYENVAHRDGVAGLDRPVLDQMISWRNPTADRLVTDFTNLGGAKVMPVIATVAALLLAWWWRRWTPVLLMVLAAGGSLVLTVVGKAAIDRARPPTTLVVPPYETSASFPSGHSINSWVILLMVAYLTCCRLDRSAGRVATVAAAVVLAVGMGLSRVYLGHHWLTDVLVAWTLGTAWLIVVITGHRLALTVVRRRSAPQRETS